MLQFNGRRVDWFGVGAPADVVGAGIATLEGKAAQLSGGGGFTPPPPPAAVAGLKAAGTAAVNTVGPAIDALSGNDPAVMKMTQQVWQLNRDQLAAVDGREGIGQADVDKAKKIVDQMVFSYKQAANLASSLAPKTAADPGQGTATSRVNIPASSPGRAPAPRSGGSSSAPAPPPPAASLTPSADDDDSSTWTWVAVGAGILALVVGGAAVAAARSTA